MGSGKVPPVTTEVSEDTGATGYILMGHIRVAAVGGLP